MLTEAFAAANLAICDAIDLHDVGLRERYILHLIRKRSFAVGRTEAFIPNLDYFSRGTNISKGNVSVILRALKRTFIIEEPEAGFYGFILPVSSWRVPLRIECVAVMEQLALLPVPQNLRGALRESFIENILPTRDASPGVVHPGRSEQDALQRGELKGGNTRESVEPAAEVQPVDTTTVRLAPPGGPSFVPESGTPYPNREPESNRTRIGYGKETPVTAQGPPTVPDSGTSPALMQYCKTAEKTVMQYCSTASSKVEEKRKRGLTAEQQEVFDQLEELGAFGKENTWLPCWFGMVKNRLPVVVELIGELNYALTQQEVKDRGAWMFDKWKRWGKPDK